MKLRERFRKFIPDQDRRCATIIHGASAAAGAAAAGAIIPGSDAVAIAPVQVGMITALADEFDVHWTDAAVRSTLYASLGTIVGKGGANLVLRWVPVYGNLIRAVVAASVTEALGWAVVQKLRTDGRLT